MSRNSTHISRQDSFDRDPIMRDDHFSLRFGNPIQEIHDAAKPTITSFEPSKDTPAVVPTIAPSPLDQEEQYHNVNNSNLLCGRTHHEGPYMTDRDASSFAEFYHKEGRVNEIDH
ncbi:hypothetical protein DM01DRAFT_1374660 [Hesseltinella vesiculosa]|uniref:Uncharacterized protein n=1 Tax=Hesseltinella vesiculosa TaxID=101127 RepID=A0A1X2GGM1_9FUNG|nr:hypothetical protein DM01DRAFT_1374660 [Hesseltinella vesiculosa]